MTGYWVQWTAPQDGPHIKYETSAPDLVRAEELAEYLRRGGMQNVTIEKKRPTTSR